MRSAIVRVGMHQIGEVAEAVGLSLRTIRHWEEVGLVPPSGRSAGGFRLYTGADVERLRLVKQMKPLGFSLEEMQEVLSLWDARSGGDGDGDREIRARLGAYASAAEARCAALRAQLAAARAMTEQLRAEADAGPISPVPGRRR